MICYTDYSGADLGCPWLQQLEVLVPNQRLSESAESQALGYQGPVARDKENEFPHRNGKC